MMLYHSVSEHLPEYVAAELSQCGVDEQVLLLQSLGKRATWTGGLLLDACIFHQLCYDLQ